MKGTGNKKLYILKKSNNKGKRFEILMEDHSHHFGSDVGKTFIDGRTQKEKENWINRHRKTKSYNSKHSALYHSRKLLWNKPTLKEAIKEYETNHKLKIINKTGIK